MKKLSVLTYFLFLGILSSCAETPVERTRLDSSGLTVVALGDAIVLSHAQPTIAAGARDYVYIGPVEINNMGHREYYLWVNLASTIDREFVRLALNDATEMVFLIDDEPMQFSISRWHTELDSPPYETTAPVYATLEARATLDQIHRIAAAETVEFHLIADSNAGSRYQYFDGDWATWRNFPEGE